MQSIELMQPLASLVAGGVKDVVGATTDALAGQMVAIVAKAGSVTERLLDTMPEEWAQLMQNAQQFGLVPPAYEMATDALVGYAFVESATSQAESIWALGPSAKMPLHLQLTDARWLAEPVPMASRPDFEASLELAVKAPQLALKVEHDDTLVMPCGESLWDDITDGQSGITLDLTDRNMPTLCPTDTPELRPLKRIRLENGDMHMAFTLARDSGIYSYTTDDGQPYSYTSLRGGLKYWNYAFLHLKKPID